MTRWLHVARWEFLTTVRKPAFVSTLAGLPIFFVAIAALLGFTIQMTTRLDRPAPIGIVDNAGIMPASGECGPLSASPAPRHAADCTLHRSESACLAALDRDEVDACYVIGESYRLTGALSGYRRPPRSLASLGAPLVHGERVARVIRSALLESASSPLAGDPLAARIVDPTASLTLHVVDRQSSATGQRVQPSPGIVVALIGSLGLGLFLTFGTFFAAGILQTAAARERQSRLHETLLAAISPGDLVTGKMVGLGAAGLLQTACHFMLLIVPTGLWLPASGLSAAQIASSAVYFFLGFALFAALLVTAGMVAGDTGTQEVATVVATVAALPMVLLAVIGVEPNGLASRALSAFPVTAPGTMLVRLGLAPVPWVDHLIAIASIVVTIAVCARLAAWLVRAAVLMTGQRLSVPMLWKLMRR